MDKKDIVRLFENETFYLTEKTERKSAGSNKEKEAVAQPEISQTKSEKLQPGVVDQKKRSGLAVLVYYPENIPPDEKSLLEKILAAVNIELRESLLVNVSTVGEDIKYSASQYLCFGVKAHQLINSQAEFYQVIKEDQATYLFSDDLKLIRDNVDLKKKLWTCLQKMFL